MNFTKTIINAIQNWVNSKFVSYSKQSPSTEQAAQARTNIGIISTTNEDIIDLMLNMNMMPVVQDADGSILVDSDNAIILI